MNGMPTLVRLLSAGIIFLVANLASCKRLPQGTELQTLENYSKENGQEVKLNQCTGTFVNNGKFVEGIVAPADLRSIIEQTLTAVPLTIRHSFTNDFAGRIVVSQNIDTDCAPAFAAISEATRLKAPQGIEVDLRSCFVKRLNPAGYDIILPANAKSIQHSLVRAYMGVAIYAILPAKDNGPAALAEAGTVANADVAGLEKAVTLALLKDFKADLASPNPTLSRKRAEEIFGPSLLVSANPEMDWASHPKFTQTMKDSIAFLATIETADQFYCSAKTRTDGAKFQNAMQAFQSEFVQRLEATANETQPSAPTYQTAGSNVANAANAGQSFGLAWRPFGGFFYNRMASRQENRYATGYGGLLFPGVRNVNQGGSVYGDGSMFASAGNYTCAGGNCGRSCIGGNCQSCTNCRYG